MAELVDAQDSKSCGSNAVRVRVSLCPPKNKSTKLLKSFKFIQFWWAKRESNSHSIATTGF